MKLIECIPNISEGRDQKIIQEITNTICNIDGIDILQTDIQYAANKTIITFIGEPEKVIVAAFLLIKKATELIDMRNQNDEYIRFGAVDICPLVPIANIAMEEVILLAKRLGNRIGEELQIPGYFYGNVATKSTRVKLENCRKVKYENLSNKMESITWEPDFGPNEFNTNIAHTGAIAITARDFLIDYNVTLKSKSTDIAERIASRLRECGKTIRVRGSIILDKDFKPKRIPGKFKSLEAIGLYREDLKCSQVSYSIVNINSSPIHFIFNETKKEAKKLKTKVRGSQLIGLIPLSIMVAAGEYFLNKKKKSSQLTELEKVNYAIKKLRLNDIKPFNLNDQIIEYRLKNLQKTSNR